MVGSGAVFIFAVEESGMKRWTDGRGWSPSRIDGNFLVSPRPFSLILRLLCGVSSRSVCGGKNVDN